MPIIDDRMIRAFLRQKQRKAQAEGAASLLLNMAEKRFGTVPPAIRKRIEALKPVGLQRAGLRLLDAGRIEDLF